MASRSPEALAALAETLGGLTVRSVQAGRRGLPKLGMPWFSSEHGNSCPCKECDVTPLARTDQASSAKTD
jgi:hypothetical protein